MEYRTLGRTGLKVSAVGIGTAQYRMIPEEQALDTLRTAFSLGVNLVHAAPDYEGSLDLVARAVRESQHEILVLSQAHGDSSHMEFLFQETCRKLGKETLELFGLACIDDRELTGENVWGAGGQIEFLQDKKRSGKVRHLFCTTHGSANYLKKLIAADIFDVLFFAFNPLGYHLLSFNQKEREIKEQLSENEEIIRLAAAADLGVMIMKPLAGGLLCRGKAFPAKSGVAPDSPLKASEILRYLLATYPGISCVVPGTASPEEARENALAGAQPTVGMEQTVSLVVDSITGLNQRLCRRCGECETTCSRLLPVSWLFRAAYVHNSSAMVFETLDQLQYRSLHPWAQAACATCSNRSCRCPFGLDIPALLCEIHEVMTRWEQEHWLPEPGTLASEKTSTEFAARLFSHNLPQHCDTARASAYTVILKNIGTAAWHPARTPFYLKVTCGVQQLASARLRAEIPPGENAHFSFLLPEIPKGPNELTVSLEQGDTSAAANSRRKGLLRLFLKPSEVIPFFICSIRRA